MRRRQGGILILTAIVMIVLMIISGGIFAFAYTNYRSSEHLSGVVKARMAADSLLFSVGTVISDDFTKTSGNKRLPIPRDRELKGSFKDGLVTADIRITSKEDRIYFLTASAQYGSYQSGEKVYKSSGKTSFPAYQASGYGIKRRLFHEKIGSIADLSDLFNHFDAVVHTTNTGRSHRP